MSSQYGTLFLVGTPIGNLGDLTPRAAEMLKEADFIAAEDTRVTLKLLNHLDIKKPMISYFEHNKARRGEEIIQRIMNGENCALVTDAGMPAISDPGADLVALCAENDVTVSVVPGPCACVSALALSGLDTTRFSFEGFLSANKKERIDRLTAVSNDDRTLIFYEAPHKLKTTLADMLKILGDRKISLVREMTKIHEEVLRLTLANAVQYYNLNDPRGEYVLVLEGQTKPILTENEETPLSQEELLLKAQSLTQKYINEGLKRTAAVKLAAKETGINRSLLYKLTTEEQ